MKRLALPSSLYSDVLGSLRQRRAGGKTVSKRQERSAWSAYWDTMARRQESVRRLQIIEDQLALQKKTAAANLALGRASLAQRRKQAAMQAALQRKALELQRQIAEYNRSLAERKLNFEESMSQQKMDLANEQADANAKAGTVKGITNLASLGLVGYNALKGTELAKTLGLGAATPTTAATTLNAGNAVPLSFAADGSPIIGGATPAAAAAAPAVAAPMMGAATPLLGGGSVTAGGTAAAGIGGAPTAAAAGGGVLSAGLTGLGVAAIPLAMTEIMKMMGIGGDPYDPTVALKAQFGTENPSLQAWQDYLSMPEKDRKVNLMDIRGGNTLGTEYENAWKQEAAKTGLWDLGKNRWATQAGTVLGNDTSVPGQRMWDTFQNSSAYIPESQRTGGQAPKYNFPVPGGSTQFSSAAGPMVAQNQGFEWKKYPTTDFGNFASQPNLTQNLPSTTAANPLIANQNFASQPAFSAPAFNMPDFKMPDFNFDMSNFKMPDFKMPDFNFGTTRTPTVLTNNWNDFGAVDDIFGGGWGG